MLGPPGASWLWGGGVVNGLGSEDHAVRIADRIYAQALRLRLQIKILAWLLQHIMCTNPCSTSPCNA